MMFWQTSKSDRGFTLIELAIVVVIIGIIAAISSPSLLGFVSRNRLNQSLQQLLSAINEAQRQATVLGRTCTITVDTNTNTITSNSNGCLLSNRQLDSEVAITTNLPGLMPSIAFSHKGSTTRMGTIVLSSNNTDFKKCFVISLGTGIKRIGRYDSNNISSVASNKCKSN